MKYHMTYLSPIYLISILFCPPPTPILIRWCYIESSQVPSFGKESWYTQIFVSIFFLFYQKTSPMFCSYFITLIISPVTYLLVIKVKYSQCSPILYLPLSCYDITCSYFSGIKLFMLILIFLFKNAYVSSFKPRNKFSLYQTYD